MSELDRLKSYTSGLNLTIVVWTVASNIATMLSEGLANYISGLWTWFTSPNNQMSDEEKNRLVVESITHAINELSSNVAVVGSSAPTDNIETWPQGYSSMIGNKVWKTANDSNVETMNKVISKIFAGYQSNLPVIQNLSNLPVANIAEKIDNFMVMYKAATFHFDTENEVYIGLADIVWTIANRPGGGGEGLTYEEWKELLDSYFLVTVGSDEVSISDLIISLLNHGNFLYY